MQSILTISKTNFALDTVEECVDEDTRQFFMEISDSVVNKRDQYYAEDLETPMTGKLNINMCL